MHNSVFSSVCAIACSLSYLCVSANKGKRVVCVHLCLPARASEFLSPPSLLLPIPDKQACPCHHTPPWEDPGSSAQLSSSLGVGMKDRQTHCSSTPEARLQHPCTASLFVSWSVTSAPTIHVMTKEQRGPALSETICQSL